MIEDLNAKLHAMLDILGTMPSSSEKRRLLILIGEAAEILESQPQD